MNFIMVDSMAQLWFCSFSFSQCDIIIFVCEAEIQFVLTLIQDMILLAVTDIYHDCQWTFPFFRINF